MNRPNACGEASEGPSWVPSANGSPLGPVLAGPQLSGHVAQERAGRDRIDPRLLHGLQQLGFGDRAVVVEVEGVPVGRVPLGDVGPGPAGRGGQVRAQLPGRGAGRLVGQGDLGGAPEPCRSSTGGRVVVVGEGGDELPDVGGLGHRVDAPGQAEQVLGLCWVAARGQLRTEGEVGGEPAGQVGADRLTGRGRLEHRPVPDEVGGRTRVAARADVHPVLLLRGEPEVVVALDGIAGVAVADPDLRVQHLEHGIP